MPRQSAMCIREVALTIETLAESLPKRNTSSAAYMWYLQKQISIQSQLQLRSHSPVSNKTQIPQSTSVSKHTPNSLPSTTRPLIAMTLGSQGRRRHPEPVYSIHTRSKGSYLISQNSSANFDDCGCVETAFVSRWGHNYAYVDLTWVLVNVYWQKYRWDFAVMRSRIVVIAHLSWNIHMRVPVSCCFLDSRVVVVCLLCMGMKWTGHRRGSSPSQPT